MSDYQQKITLSFVADTAQAKKQIQDLSNALKEVGKLPGKSTEMFGDLKIKEASQAAIELQRHLSAAVNVNTGKLDLSRFSTSVKSAGKDLNSYYNTLLKAGPAGEQAFLQLARAVSTAETPVTRVNKRLQEMGISLKNTIKWQISSSAVHAFMGTIQKAYSYAEDLNKSLNNIRIVTGQSVDQMDKFAEKANKAAKALSTTTTKYTDAALIFYQQGLGDAEVEARTNATIKMANVTGDSATEVSSYMTAIWNNFAKGSEELEHYADVITALGAATASSSAEISEGLEKFAAIADTVGLSYDYATTALATVVAQTRQSADTVGTAFKTIFGRLQGLTLGDTLEDGTNLNKYSKALNSVGINIKEVNGDIKDMDTILDELGAKWNTLAKDQQVALAQTVGGTRQYQQLIALMDNWETFQENLITAQNSDGTLDRQAQIYAESWEAARDRVKAAWQEVYKALLDDKFFIKTLNMLEKLIDGVSGFVKGMGGLKGILVSAGGVLLTLYANKLPDAFNNLKQNLMVFTGAANKEMRKSQQQTQDYLQQLQSDSSKSGAFKAEAEGIARVNSMQQELLKNSRYMTEAQQLEAKMRIENIQSLNEEVVAYHKVAEAKKDAVEVEIKRIKEKAIKNYGEVGIAIEEAPTDLKNEQAKIQQKINSNLFNDKKELTKARSTRTRLENDMPNKVQEVQDKTNELENLKQQQKELKAKIATTTDSGWQTRYGEKLKEVEKNISQVNAELGKSKISLKEAQEKYEEINRKITEYDALVEEEKRLEKQIIEAEEDRTFLRDNLGITELEGQESYKKEKSKQVKAAMMDNQVKKGIAEASEGYQQSEVSRSVLSDIQRDAKQSFSNIEELKDKVVAKEKDIDNLKNSMKAYLDTVKKVGKENGVAFDDDAINNFEEELANAGGDAEQLYTKFKALMDTQVFGTGSSFDKAIAESTVQSEKFKKVLELLEIDVSELDEKNIELAQSIMKIFYAETSVNSEGGKLDKTYASASQAMGEFAGVVMQASSLITTLKNAFDTFNDEDATVFDKIGASIGVLTTALFTLNAITQLNNTLSRTQFAQYVKLPFGLALSEKGFLGLAAAETAADVAALPLIAVLAAVAAGLLQIAEAVAFVVIIFKAIEATTPEGKLKAASKAADEATKSFENAKNAFEDLKNSLSSYDEAKTALDELKVGTEEWYEQVLKLNQAMMDIIEKYPELANLVEYDENGVLRFKTEEAEKEYINKEQDNLTILSRRRQALIAREKDIKINNNKEKYFAGFGGYSNFNIDNVIEYFNNNPNALLANSEDELKEIAKNFKLYDAEAGWDTYAAELAIEGYKKYQKDLINYDNSLNVFGAGQLSRENQGRKYSNYVQQTIGKQTMEAVEKYASGGAYDAGYRWQDVDKERYAELNKLYYEDGKIYKDSTKSEQVRPGIIKGRRFLAQYDEINKIDENEIFTNINKEVEKVKDESDAYKDVVAQIAAGIENVDYTHLSADEINKITTQEFNGNKPDDLSGYYDEEIKKILDKIIYEPVKTAYTILGDKTDNLTIAGTDNLTQLMTKAFEEDGQKGLYAFVNTINEKTIKAFNEDIDWTADNVDEQLKEKGLNITDDFKAIMKKLTESTESFDITSFQDKIKKLNDILDKLKIGDTISSEDYEALGGDLYSDYFTKMADGTYMLIQDAKEFYDLVKENQKKEIEENIDKLEDKIAKEEGQLDKWNNIDSKDQQSAFDINSLEEFEKIENAKLINTVLGTKGLSLSVFGENKEQAFKAYQNALNENLALENTIASNKEKLYDLRLNDATLYSDTDSLVNSNSYRELSEEDKGKVTTTAAIEEGTKLGFDAKEITEYSNELENLYDNLKNIDGMAERIAIDNMKLNEGYKKLKDNFDKWDTELKKGIGSSEYAATISEIKDVISEMFDVDKNNIDTQFITDNLDLIKKAAKGNLDAIAEMSRSLAIEMTDSLGDGELIDNALEKIKDFDYNLVVGTTLDDAGMTDAFNALIREGEASVDQVNEILSGIGWQPTITYQQIDYQQAVKLKGKSRIYGSDNGQDEITGEQELQQNATYWIPVVNGKKSAYSGPPKGAISGANKKKSGGGGSKSKKDKKDYDDEFDRYWQLKKNIDKVNESLEDLQNLQGHVFGKQLIQNLQAQNKQLEIQKKNYQALFEEQKKEAGELQGLLGGTYGVQFTEDGKIANYAAITRAQLDAYNAAVDAYNNGTMSEADFTVIEKKYAEFKQNLSRYDTLRYSEMQDTIDKMEELRLKTLENNLKAWETDIQIGLDTEQASRDWADFLNSINKDFKLHFTDYDKELDAITNKMSTYLGKTFNLNDLINSDLSSLLKDSGSGTLAIDQKAIADVEAEIDKLMNGQESTMFASLTEAQNKLKELNETYQKDIQDTYALYEEAWNAYMSSIDQAGEKFSDLMNKYKQLDDYLNHQQKMTELIYGSKAYNLYGQIYDTQIENSKQQISSLSQQVDMWKKLYDTAEEGSEEQVKYYEKWQEAQSNLNSQLENYIDLLSNKYTNAIEKAISTAKKAIYGTDNSDWVSQRWEDALDLADDYYDQVERIYELESLETKWENAISSTKSLKGQQKMSEMMKKQMEYIKNKAYLNEYDIGLEERRIELMKAEIALEEARDNKNTMKLTRNAAGNWTYQYVADQDDLNQKQQDYLDKQHEIYEYTKEGEKNALAEMLSTQEEAMNRIREVAEKVRSGEYTKEQAEEEYKYLNKYYYGEGGKLSNLFEQANIRKGQLNEAAIEDLKALYDVDTENYKNMTDQQKAIMDALRDGRIKSYKEIQKAAEEMNTNSLTYWETTVKAMADLWDGDGEESFKNAFKKATEECMKAFEEFEAGIKAGSEAAGFDITAVASAVSAISAQINGLKGATESLVNDTTEKLNQYKEVVNKLAQVWDNVKNSMVEASNKVYDYLNLMQDLKSTLEEVRIQAEATSSAVNSVDPSGGGSGDTITKTPSGYKFLGKQGVAYSMGQDRYKFNLYDENSKKWINILGSESTSGTRDELRNALAKKLNIANSQAEAIIKDAMKHIGAAVKFDTGGYTGDWNGTQGRFAMLHSKELVLNKQDTENMLETVNTVRSIASIGNSITDSITNGIGKMISSIFGLGAKIPGFGSTTSSTSDNMVFNINAEFPNANNADEIQKALLSLPNLASQYIGKRN